MGKQEARGRHERSRGEERYQVALTNLTFYLATRGRPKDRERALGIGAEVAKRVDDFENRDSFMINYAFARLVYADSPQELDQAIAYLAKTLERKLSELEREEVMKYMGMGLRRAPWLGAA